jgi:hypothetical protein
VPANTWAPTLPDVGRHIPTRTRDLSNPGSDVMLGTFTANTTPDDAAAQGFIDDAVQWVVASAGAMPAGLPPTDEIMVAARYAAEWRAAADIEFAYPNRDMDVKLAQQLDTRAKDALSTLISGLQKEGEGVIELVPVWAMPPPWAIDRGSAYGRAAEIVAHGFSDMTWPFQGQGAYPDIDF